MSMGKVKNSNTSDAERQKNRQILNVTPSMSLWTDYDTNQKYLVENKGYDAVPVDAIGQIPSRFVQDVTGVKNYRDRKSLVKDPRLRPD